MLIFKINNENTGAADPVEFSLRDNNGAENSHHSPFRKTASEVLCSFFPLTITRLGLVSVILFGWKKPPPPLRVIYVVDISKNRIQ